MFSIICDGQIYKFMIFRNNLKYAGASNIMMILIIVRYVL